MVELDRVEDAKRLRAEGFDAVSADTCSFVLARTSPVCHKSMCMRREHMLGTVPLVS